METVQARETEIYWLIYRTKRLVIMWKSIHSLLLPLVLISGSLVTCEPINLQPEPSPSITSSPSNTDQGDLKKSFDDFQTSLDDFMKDIVAVENNSKEEKSVQSTSKYFCHICSLDLRKGERYRKHMNKHSEKFKCNDCRKCFQDGNDLRRHTNKQFSCLDIKRENRKNESQNS